MDNKLVFLKEPYVYRRRDTRAVRAGKVQIGGGAPVVVQSMLTCDTMDTRKCVEQTLELVKVGCEVVRITAPTVKDAANLKNIKEALLSVGCDVPIVADIHFKPEAAMEAAQWVDAVRINPGNFADKKKFQSREYTQDQYNEELMRIEECFAPLVKLCKERGIAMRIGTNHGSLSDRIMNYYGDTPLGMVESALEYARVARKYDYHNFVFSMKSSNPKVMIQAYRLLVAKLDAEGPDWNYPLHLGVTEAGDGEDGRIKSAIGIGSLLLDGIGDTIRVSLTEDSVHEIPVGQALVAWVKKIQSESREPKISPRLAFDPFSFNRRPVPVISFSNLKLGAGEPARVIVSQQNYEILSEQKKSFGDTPPEGVYETLSIEEIDPENSSDVARINAIPGTKLITVNDGCRLNPVTAYRLLDAQIEKHHAILIKDTFLPPNPREPHPEPLEALIQASVVIGSLICDGIGDAIWVRSEPGSGAALRLSYNILQASGNRTFKTDYVACPSCGRTLFDLQSTTARIKSATAHLKGVKIAVMGCIVNGPGEMADADFGYVGGAPGKINLYVGKNPVKFNIPESEAVDRLKDLIREHGKWTDPQ